MIPELIAANMNKIKQSIAAGLLDDALKQVIQSNTGMSQYKGIVLQNQYINGKKQYNMGLIEFSEWQCIQAQINYALLQLLN